MDKYTRLTAQPFRLYFLFKITKAGLPSPETIWSESGSVEVEITVNNLRYGPFDTGIKTTFGLYHDRRSLQPTEEASLVTQELHKFIKLIHDAHTQLMSKEGLMNGLMIMSVVQHLKGLSAN